MKKYIVLIFIMILLTISAIILILQLATGTNDSKNPATSYPVGSDQEDSSIFSPVNFTLKTATINPNNPFSDPSVRFVSKIEASNINNDLINPSIIAVNSNDFALIIINGGEGNPIGLDTPIPENLKLQNEQIGNIYRVEYSKDEAVKSIFENSNLGFSSRYFYSDDFKTNLDCGPDYTGYFCGGSTISLIDDNFTKFKIYCGVNDSQNVKYCDQFVENLKVEPKYY